MEKMLSQVRTGVGAGLQRRGAISKMGLIFAAGRALQQLSGGTHLPCGGKDFGRRT